MDPMTTPPILLAAWLTTLLLGDCTSAQNLAAMLQKVELVEEFDADKNARLDQAERQKARAAIRERRSRRRSFGRPATRTVFGRGVS